MGGLYGDDDDDFGSSYTPPVQKKALAMKIQQPEPMLQDLVLEKDSEQEGNMLKNDE